MELDLFNLLISYSSVFFIYYNILQTISLYQISFILLLFCLVVSINVCEFYSSLFFIYDISLALLCAIREKLFGSRELSKLMQLLLSFSLQ